MRRPHNRMLLGVWLALGVVYVITRTAGLDQSLWEDEVYTLHHYVSGDLSAIFDPSAYISNNHPLYSLISNGLHALFGVSEVVLRAVSVVPATAAMAAMAYWLWRRYGNTPALAFAFMATFSPMHFEEFRQARGWGLALTAATIVLVASLEMQRSEVLGWHHIAWFAGGSLVGIWTIYAIALPFLIHGLILLVTRRERVKLGFAALVVGLGSVLFYWPLRTALVDPAGVRSGPNTGSRDGVVGLGNVAVEPLDRLLTPLFGLVTPGAIATVIAALLVVGGVVALWRRNHRLALLHLVVPVAVVFGALAARETAIWDRYVSFLLFHILVLAAFGASWFWEMTSTETTRIGLTSLYGLVGLLILLGFIPYATTVASVPQENFKGAAELVESVPGLRAAYVHTFAFEFIHNLDDVFLERVSREEFVEKSCSQEGPAAFIDYPRRSPMIESECLEDRAALISLPQRRNPPIKVWLVPERLCLSSFRCRTRDVPIRPTSCR